MISENYTYETKCRRCGSLEEWHFSNREQLEWTKFVMAMSDYIANPRLYNCNTCGKPTIQDVVSYTDAH